jgi:cell division protein FtsL
MKNKKKIGRYLIVAVIAASVGFLFLGNDSIMNIYKLRMDVKKKEHEIQKGRKEIDSLTLEQKKLKTDTAYIERIAREKMGMAGKNEKVYKFIEEK